MVSNRVQVIVQSSKFHRVALFVFAALLYSKSMSHDFILSWDDHVYVIYNIYIRAITTDNIYAILSTPFIGNYLPLHILSYMFDYALWGLNPSGYHVINVFLHAVGAVLVYDVVSRISGGRFIALFVAAVFVAHPINVEAVSWISQRKTLLSAVFFFGSLLAYFRWRRDSKKLWYGLALLFSVLSVFSKTSTVILPVIFIGYEILIVREKPIKWIAFLPFVIVSLAGTGGTVLSGIRGTAIADNTFTSEYLFSLVYPTMIPVYGKYFLLLIAPVNLSAFYDTTIYRSFYNPVILLSLSTYLYLSVMIIRFGGNEFRFWVLWSVVCFLPSANIIPIQIYYADRFMYLSMIGFYACIAIAARDVIRWSTKKLNMNVNTTITFVVSIMILVALVGLTYERIDVWRNELSLWSDTAQKSPDIYNVRMNYGTALKRAKRYKAALKQYENAAKLRSTPEVIWEIRTLREIVDDSLRTK
ncbi:MAG: hypothetical protein C0600_14190 [Ignavibacteria bacterium]|nr:MAG: hypothetical protein C0600_14190 [Ignavibacteria bacterium]